MTRGELDPHSPSKTTIRRASVSAVSGSMTLPASASQYALEILSVCCSSRAIRSALSQSSTASGNSVAPERAAPRATSLSEAESSTIRRNQPRRASGISHVSSPARTRN
jgi:hypothetical protein